MAKWQTCRLKNKVVLLGVNDLDKIVAEEAVAELQTIQDVLRWAVSCFQAADLWYGHGTDNAWDEAVQLILPTLCLPFDYPDAMYGARLTTSERQHIVELVIRRIDEHIPVAYLTNKAWFCGLEFYVDERVLIPRSPVGELIQKRFSGVVPQKPHLILDMCTGSGCIAIACATAFPDAQVDAADLSCDALLVTEMNIEQHAMMHQVTPIQSDLFRSLTPVQYDLIITNPPYVDSQDMATLPDEYRHEPEIGLAAGSDGLDLVKRILACAPDYLSAQGILICEVGNSRIHLTEQYPDLPFAWLKFDKGGEGVFMLTRDQLVDAQHHFVAWRS